MHRFIMMALLKASEVWNKLANEAWPQLTSLVGFVRRRRRACYIWPEAPIPLAAKVAILVHFERKGWLRPDLINYLLDLGRAGFSVIFVSNSGVGNKQISQLQDHCAAIVFRKNSGYDFCAWREAMEIFSIPNQDTQQLLLVNDSVYGPLLPLGPVLEKIDFRVADFWGMTESWQHRYHLQSYFLVAGPKAMASKAWKEFWSHVRPAPSKHFIIRKYEIGLTQDLLEDGLICQALWTYRDLISWVTEDVRNEPTCLTSLRRSRTRHKTRLFRAISNCEPLNPTSDLWRPLMETGFPFIKRELLRDNPGRVSDLAEWRLIASRLFSRPVLEAVEQDLARTLRNRTP
jgi:hypothetical protein